VASGMVMLIGRSSLSSMLACLTVWTIFLFILMTGESELRISVSMFMYFSALNVVLPF